MIMRVKGLFWRGRSAIWNWAKGQEVEKDQEGRILEVEDVKGVEKLIKHQTLTDAGMKVVKPTQGRPVIMVYDVYAKLEDKEIK